MPEPATIRLTAPLPEATLLPVSRLKPSHFNIEVYGEPTVATDGLFESISRAGILVPLVVVDDESGAVFEVLSGNRRLACARELGIVEALCFVRNHLTIAERQRLVLEYNRQRRKTFSQIMREADALERIERVESARRQRSGLRGQKMSEADNVRRNSGARTDETVARAIGLGGKDLYRQARAVWKCAQTGDSRAQASVARLDDGGQTIHAAYKDLRRRDRFTTGFKPTPYDVWSFRHDRSYGIPHPGSIPPGIVAHMLHYYTKAGDLVVDPMAGGGSTLDVCEAMGRRCFSYDLAPTRSEIKRRDVRDGFAPEALGCDLIFADPPYHTMLSGSYAPGSLSETNLTTWLAFLDEFARASFAALAPGGIVALLLANQTEKGLPAGHGYLDHVFFGYSALLKAGFLPERRVSCPMSGSYLPQDVARARRDGRMLGVSRDLVVMRKPLRAQESGVNLPTASS